MAGSGVARITMSQKGATNASFKGDYNKKVAGIASRAVHNQKGSRVRGK